MCSLHPPRTGIARYVPAAAYGDKTDIFAGWAKIIFKIHRPVG